MSTTNIPELLEPIQFESEKTNIDNVKFKEKLKFFYQHISVEPLILFYVITVAMNNLTTQNLYLEKSCRVNLKFNQSVCDAILTRNKSGYEPQQEIAVQELVSEWISYKSIIIGTIPVLIMIFLGSWSDRHSRRKPIILLPIIGDTLGTVGLFFCSYFFDELPLQFSWFFETFSFSLFGGWGCAFIGIYSYISSETNSTNRTLKIGVASIVNSVAMSVGVFLSGIAVNRLGFIGAYTISFTSQVIAIFYTCTMIREPNTENNVKFDGFFKDLFAVKHITNTFRVCFEKDQFSNRRTRIIVIMIIGLLSIGPLQGEITLLYMYVRIKLGWNEVDFSIFNSNSFIIMLVGKTLAMSFFASYLEMSDAFLGILSMLSKISACIFYAFAPSGIYFYIGSFVEILYGASYIVLRSILGKTVPKNQLGQTNSIFGICEAVMPSFFGPLYNNIYIYTVRFFPGFYYLVTIQFYSICFVLFIWLYRDERRKKAESLTENHEQNIELLEKNKMITVKSQTKK